MGHPALTAAFFVLLIACSCLLFPRLGMDFFPSVDAGQMRLHVRAPAGTKLETTQAEFAKVEREIRKIVGSGQIDVILDNIGLPYSGINIALSDSATVGPMDGEILISLKEGHSPTPEHMSALRRRLPKLFPQLQFFFQPADIVNQVLNFGQQAPIDIRVTGPKSKLNHEKAKQVLADLRKVPGVVDAHIFQVPDAPSIKLDVDRTLASQVGMSQHDVADNVLVTLNSSVMVAPNFWLSPTNAVSYPLVVQTPTYQVSNVPELTSLPITVPGQANQLLMNVASVSRGQAPMVMSQLNIRPVFDVHADVQGRDLGSVADEIEKILDKDKPDEGSAMHLTIAGQIQTMRQSFNGLAGGIAMAVVLVFLLMVINFQSWLDPLIVLMAVPCALGGVMWMLFGTHTHISVPALMGSLMCIGLTTANSILVVSFANQRMEAGDTARNGRHRRGIHSPAAGDYDRRGDDPWHGADGPGPWRRRRTKRPPGPGGDRRIDLRNLRHAYFCPVHVLLDAPPSRGNGCDSGGLAMESSFRRFHCVGWGTRPPLDGVTPCSDFLNGVVRSRALDFVGSAPRTIYVVRYKAVISESSKMVRDADPT